ncbi:LCI fold-containing protein [Bacillus cereus]|uniref:LCI fold-containing protein n=1 Tax=Bacillus cereus TaxID=1396 RepID=UPI00362E13DB
MFKKLVVGALATGIALTGGIGAASASTVPVDNVANSAIESNSLAAKYTRWVPSEGPIFANDFYEDGIHWYFKGPITKGADGYYYGYYEGRAE